MAKYRLFFNGRTLDIECDSFKRDQTTNTVTFLTKQGVVIAEFSHAALHGFAEINSIQRDDEAKGTE
jgi:hypothetical protein